jgi:hypothetical protein
MRIVAVSAFFSPAPSSAHCLFVVARLRLPSRIPKTSRPESQGFAAAPSSAQLAVGPVAAVAFTETCCDAEPQFVTSIAGAPSLASTADAVLKLAVPPTPRTKRSISRRLLKTMI